MVGDRLFPCYFITLETKPMTMVSLYRMHTVPREVGALSTVRHATGVCSPPPLCLSWC